jgi:hypothetical protein
MKVGERVAEHLVVELDRLEDLLQSSSHYQELAPIRLSLLVGELGRLGDMTAAPRHDGESTLDVASKQVSVGVTSPARKRTLCFV